jgi:hypothetical protein
MRTGYCEAPKADFGNHSVAGNLPQSPLLAPIPVSSFPPLLKST